MRDYIDMTGKTEEEAIGKALNQLGLDRDEVSVEILERAKSGFLGIGRSDAKVRIRYGEEKPDPAPEPIEPGAADREEKSRATNERNDRGGRRRGERAESHTAEEKDHGGEKGAARTGEKPGAGESPSSGDDGSAGERRSRRRGQDRPERGDSAEAAPEEREPGEERTRSRRRRQDRKRQEPRNSGPESAAGNAAPLREDGEEPADAAPPVDLGEEVDDEKAQAIKAFLTGLLNHMETEAVIRVYHPEEGRYKVILEGQGMGALIGRRGETLDAIQQLTNYSVNRGGTRVRIQLDAEGYREKRERSLRNLARKEAAKVVKYRRSRTLEPMNAYERHVIHTALQEYPGVNTYSTGVDPNRRVVVAYDREKL